MYVFTSYLYKEKSLYCFCTSTAKPQTHNIYFLSLTRCTSQHMNKRMHYMEQRALWTARVT